LIRVNGYNIPWLTTYYYSANWSPIYRSVFE